MAEAIDVFWNTDPGYNENLTKFSNFVQFIEKAKPFTYDGLTHTWVDGMRFRDILSGIGCSVDADDCLKIKEFMSEKKKHEVSGHIYKYVQLSSLDSEALLNDINLRWVNRIFD